VASELLKLSTTFLCSGLELSCCYTRGSKQMRRTLEWSPEKTRMVERERERKNLGESCIDVLHPLGV
jgi:hypothetical protein